jgi:hypothetical protein
VCFQHLFEEIAYIAGIAEMLALSLNLAREYALQTVLN